MIIYRRLPKSIERALAPANFTSCATTCLFRAKLEQNEWTLTWNWGFWMRSAPRRYRWFSLASWGYLVRSAGSLLLLTGPNRLGNWNNKIVRFNFQFLYALLLSQLLLLFLFTSVNLFNSFLLTQLTHRKTKPHYTILQVCKRTSYSSYNILPILPNIMLNSWFNSVLIYQKPLATFQLEKIDNFSSGVEKII